MINLTGLRRERQTPARTIIAVAIGNSLEWFEIIIYGYFAGVIAQLFFPAQAPSVSLLLAFATFGATFVARPAGAIFLGVFADRRGRKAALQLSIVLMTLASAAIAFVPTYQSIGILAPLILVIARLVQGFAVGGEFGSATVLLAEQDPKRRGYYASWQFASQGGASVLATMFGVATLGWLSAEQVSSWGWRLPFIFGLLIAPVGFYIRTRVSESVEFVAKPKTHSPLKNLILEKKIPMLAAIGVIMLGTVATYTNVFLPTFAIRHLGITAANSFASSLLTACLQVLIVPLVGAWSDRWNRSSISIIAAIAILVLAYPLFAWLSSHPTIERLLFCQIILGVLTAVYVAPLPALMSELFPATSRTTALSLSYALGVALFGGFTPFIQVWLIEYVGKASGPGYYLVAAAAGSLIALLVARRHMARMEPASAVARG